MEYVSEVEKQRRQRYKDHDLPIEDIPRRDIDHVRELAIRDFVETRDSDNVKLIIASFLGYLTSKGYRVVKKETL